MLIGTRGYHGPPVDFKPPSMNELPVPQGSWQADYNRRQGAYNLQLAAGVIILTSTISFVSTFSSLSTYKVKNKFKKRVSA